MTRLTLILLTLLAVAGCSSIERADVPPAVRAIATTIEGVLAHYGHEVIDTEEEARHAVMGIAGALARGEDPDVSDIETVERLVRDGRRIAQLIREVAGK